MAAAPPAKWPVLVWEADAGELGGLSVVDWSTFKRRGREILRRARDPEQCVRRLKAKTSAFINSNPGSTVIRGGKDRKDSVESVGGISTPDSARRIEDRGSKCQVFSPVSIGINSVLKQVGNGQQELNNLEIKFEDSSAEFGEKKEYFKREISGFIFKPAHPTTVFLAAASVSVCVLQGTMGDHDAAAMELSAIGTGQGSDLGAPAPTSGLPAAAGSAGPDAPALVGGSGVASMEVGPGVSASSELITSPSIPVVQGAGEALVVRAPSLAAPSLPQGKATVGGPSGLALSVTPLATVGFASAAVAPPSLRRASKSKALVGRRAVHEPAVIDMEAAMRAVAGKLVVARVLSPYEVDHKAVTSELRGPWRLRGNAVVQRVTNNDHRFCKGIFISKMFW